MRNAESFALERQDAMFGCGRKVRDAEEERKILSNIELIPWA